MELLRLIADFIDDGVENISMSMQSSFGPFPTTIRSKKPRRWGALRQVRSRCGFRFIPLPHSVSSPSHGCAVHLLPSQAEQAFETYHSGRARSRLGGIDVGRPL